MASSEEFTDGTYWDPYSKSRKPVLTQEQVDGMWPNIKVKRAPATAPRELGPKAQEAAKLNVIVNASPFPPSAPKHDMVNLPEHYARYPIEPIRFIAENKLDWFQGNIIKYVTRWDAKNGLEDLAKVIRYATMYRLFASGDPDWWKAGKPEDFKIAA